MNKLAKFLLAATAFAPSLLIYALVSASNSEYGDSAIFLGFFALLVSLCVFFLCFSKIKLESLPYRASTVEPADKEVFSLLLVYLLPLLTVDLSIYNWEAWILIAFFFCVVVSTSYGYYFNPLLVLFGYHFYKIAESDGVPHVLITRRRIYKTGELLHVCGLAEYILIEKSPPD